MFAVQNPEATKIAKMVQHIGFTLFLLSFSINFFLYCVSGQNFRYVCWFYQFRFGYRCQFEPFYLH